jgi:hypothetical protein
MALAGVASGPSREPIRRWLPLLEGSAAIDDRTTAYAHAMEPAFSQLIQAAALIGGVMALMAAGSKAIAPDHSALRLAREFQAAAIEIVVAAAVTDAARHHHRHLLCAARSLGEALTHVGALRPGATVDDGFDAVLTPLRIGWDDLRRTSDALPGFEIISFDQACCACGAYRVPMRCD